MGFGRAAIAVDADDSVLELNGFCSAFWPPSAVFP